MRIIAVSQHLSIENVLMTFDELPEVLLIAGLEHDDIDSFINRSISRMSNLLPHAASFSFQELLAIYHDVKSSLDEGDISTGGQLPKTLNSKYDISPARSKKSLAKTTLSTASSNVTKKAHALAQAE